MKKLRNERDNEKVKKALAEIKKVAGGNENLMPAVLNAVKSYATLGEICDVLKEAFGEYRPVQML